MTLQSFSTLRVLDLSKVLAGPLCTQYLADLGAEVIKIEPVAGGDETRSWPPLHAGEGAVFLSCNRNKRSLAVDLKTVEGRAIVHDLARRSDIVVESFATGVAERLGVDYGTLRPLRPDMIYCSISGFGRTGPLSKAPGYDVILQAYTGIMAMTGEPGSGPVRIPISPIDQATGIQALAAINARLLERQITGQGCRIEVSLYETAVALLGYSLQIFWEKGVNPEKNGSGHESLCPYQAFETADMPILLGVANDGLWQRFCSVAGLAAEARDPRFATNPARVANRPQTLALVQEALRRRPCADWIERLGAVGIPCAPINTMADLVREPHAHERGMFLEHRDARLGHLRGVAWPVTMDGRKAGIRRPPPALGEDTAAVLAELDYPAERIEALCRDGVIGRAPTSD